MQSANQSAHTRAPVAQYEIVDPLGEHTIEVPRATRRANQMLTTTYRTTEDILVRELFAYVHEHRDFVPLDVWDGALRQLQGDAVIVVTEDRGSLTQSTVLRQTGNGLRPEHQPVLLDADEPLLATQADLSDSIIQL